MFKPTASLCTRRRRRRRRSLRRRRSATRRRHRCVVAWTAPRCERSACWAQRVFDGVRRHRQGLYTILVDTEISITAGKGQFVFKVFATTTSGKGLQSNSSVEVNNQRPGLEWVAPAAANGIATFKNFENTTLTVQQKSTSTFNITRVEFFREVNGSSAQIGSGVKSGSGSNATWSIDVHASVMAAQSLIAVKAVAYSSTKQGTAVITGKVTELPFQQCDQRQSHSPGSPAQRVAVGRRCRSQRIFCVPA